jgi:hypothetical protein
MGTKERKGKERKGKGREGKGRKGRNSTVGMALSF